MNLDVFICILDIFTGVDMILQVGEGVDMTWRLGEALEGFRNDSATWESFRKIQIQLDGLGGSFRKVQIQQGGLGKL